MTPNRKKLVYGGQKELDSHIARLVKSGWKVITTQICYQARGKKVYIAELEKNINQYESPQNLPRHTRRLERRHLGNEPASRHRPQDGAQIHTALRARCMENAAPDSAAGRIRISGTEAKMIWHLL